MDDPFVLPSLEQIEQMERQRSQAIESLEISGNSVKCQRCSQDIPIVGKLNRPDDEGSSEAGIRRAAKNGDGWMASAYNITPDKFKEKRSILLSDRKRLGKDSESFENCIMSMFGYIDNDKDKVRRMVKNILSPALGRPAEHLDFETIPVPKTKDLFAIIRPEIMKQQTDISQVWTSTKWSSICNELTKISSPTLILTGTDDNNVPPANSLIIAGKIPGVWVVQIKEVGHGLLVQYPNKVNKVLQTFLTTTIPQIDKG